MTNCVDENLRERERHRMSIEFDASACLKRRNSFDELGSQTHPLPSQADGAALYQPNPESRFRSQLAIARLGLHFDWLPTRTLFHRAEP
ncbi:MAG: hypothetical protein WCK15_17990 [Pirellula sp.]